MGRPIVPTGGPTGPIDSRMTALRTQPRQAPRESARALRGRGRPSRGRRRRSHCSGLANPRRAFGSARRVYPASMCRIELAA